MTGAQPFPDVQTQGSVRPTTAQIEAVLQEAFSPTRLDVQDDSHLHAGHAGAREGGHYTVRIRSARFAGLNRVARHRLIYHALGDWMPSGIHALAVDADVSEPG
jgi:BolA family transcriptional regulator, general stress-responsive regulator